MNSGFLSPTFRWGGEHSVKIIIKFILKTLQQGKMVFNMAVEVQNFAPLQQGKMVFNMAVEVQNFVPLQQGKMVFNMAVGAQNFVPLLR